MKREEGRETERKELRERELAIRERDRGGGGVNIFVFVLKFSLFKRFIEANLSLF